MSIDLTHEPGPFETALKQIFASFNEAVDSLGSWASFPAELYYASPRWTTRQLRAARRQHGAEERYARSLSTAKNPWLEPVALTKAQRRQHR